jgi:hypothetical protein
MIFIPMPHYLAREGRKMLQEVILPPLEEVNVG